MSSLTPGQQVIALGDFNQDGNLDIVVTSRDDNNVLVYLNNSGDGTFHEGYASYPVGASPIAVAVGDFNRDGNLDIVTGNEDGTVTVLLNNGDGTFQARSPIPCGFYSHSIAVGDFNRDGNLDILTANYDNSTITVLLGKGDGTFQAQSPINIGGEHNGYYGYPWAFTVGDLNNDGNLDIVFVDDDSYIWIGLGKGDGTFGPFPFVSFDTNPYAVAVADFNNDGNLDILTVDQGSFLGLSPYRATVLLGHGDGTFLYQGPGPGLDLNKYPPIAVAVGDFNHDGNMDFAVANYDSLYDEGYVSVLLGNGDGNFQPATLYFAPHSSVVPLGIAVGDFTNNGVLDIVTANKGNFITIYSGNGDGTFQPHYPH